MDLDQKFVKLYEGWKKGKYKITDDKGNIIGTYNSGSKAQKVVDDLMQQGKYDKLTVEIIEAHVKHECPKCKGEGCEHCDGKGYHVEDEDDDPVGKNEASTYRDRSQQHAKKQGYKKKYGKMPFQFTNKKRDQAGVRVEDGELDEMPNRAYKEKINTLLKDYHGKFKWKGDELYVSKEIEKDVRKIISKDKGHSYMVKVSSNPMREDYDKNQLLRVQHDERLIAEAGDICSLDKADLRSKAMQKVYDKKCSPEMIKKKKSIFGKIAKGLDLYNGDKMQEATNLKQLRKQYDKNEDENRHTENYLLLAKAFGSKSEVKKVEDIMKRNEKQGHTSKSDMDWMYKNINPYYDKIRNEEYMKLEDAVKQVLETNKNDKSDDGEGLDAVQPKAVKKKFKDRKDKDIDNDGDTDDSDKFLHKKRKAISKAIASKKEEKTYSKLYSHVKNLMSK